MCKALIIAGQEKVRYLSIDDGLANNTTTCIFRDKQGFMWFGTYDGLNRYDGYVFKKYNHIIGDSTSLAGNLIKSIAQDSQGNHWIAAEPGISVLDDKTSSFHRVNYNPFSEKGNGGHPSAKKEILKSYVSCLINDGTGNMIAGTYGQGLFVFKNGGLSGLQIGLSYRGKIIADYSVTALVSIKGQTWLYVQKIGLCLYDNRSGIVVVKHEDNINANCLALGDNQTLLAGTDNGLYEYGINNSSLSAYKTVNGKPLQPGRIKSLCKDSDERLWIATDGNGISVVDTKTHQVLPLSHIIGSQSIGSNAIYCIYKDDQERIWIGTFRGGVNVIDRGGNPFYSVRLEANQQNSPVNNFIFSFCEDNSGQIWIGTDGAGIRVWNRKTNAFKTYSYSPGKNGLTGDNISALATDNENNVWIGSYDGGIVKFDNRSKTFFNVSKSGSCKQVWRLFKDRSGNIWAGCRGLYKYDKNKGEFIAVISVEENIHAITEDRFGRLWVGLEKRLKCIDKKGNELTTITSDHNILSIIEDKSGTIWAGTQGGGLIKYVGGNYRFYTEQQGLPNNNVLNLLEDSSGAIWMSTYHGLSKLTPAKVKFDNFFDVDGLQSNQFYYNAALKLRSGELMFGGIKGFTVFNPEACIPKKQFPVLAITGIRILNQEENSTGEYVKGNSLFNPEKIEVPYSKAVLSIDFAALEYSIPRKIQYSYFLEGWDKNWVMAGSLKTANYSELREGRYTLRIKSTNASGVWNTTELRLPIVVLPPWYRTWWAQFAVVLIILGIAGTLLYYWEKQRRIKYKMKIVELRHNHEMELNEKRLSFFTNLSHEFRSPLTLIINPIRELIKNGGSANNINLGVLYSNAQRLLKITDQLLLFRKIDNELGKIQPEYLDLLNLCRQIYFCFTDEANSKSLHYEFICSLEEAKVYADAEKIEIVIFNLLSNAIKFSRQNGQVIMRLEEIEGEYRMLVQDNGPGIAPEDDDKIFKKFYQDKQRVKSEKGFGIGLYLAKAFADMHRAVLSYHCPKSGGTIFTFTLKKTDEYNFSFPEESVHVQKITEKMAESGLSAQSFLGNSTNRPTEELEIPDTQLSDLITDKKVMLVVDNDSQLTAYIKHLFGHLVVYEAGSMTEGWKRVQELVPDIIISDVFMNESTGIELCKKVKSNSAYGHIPVILFTGSSSDETHIKAVECGADDYIIKPFDSELLIKRVDNILKDRNALKEFFSNEITLQPDMLKVSDEFRGFLNDCIAIVEENIERDDFDSQAFANKMGMSRSTLYVKVKTISGLSVNEFIKLVRLRKAAELMIHTNCQVKEISFQVGFNDQKYFREQFTRLFKLKPSEYIKKYRKSFQGNTHLNSQFSKIKDK